MSRWSRSRQYLSYQGGFSYPDSEDDCSDSGSQEWQDGDLASQEGKCSVFVSPQGSSFPDDVSNNHLYRFFCSEFGRRQIRYANISRNRKSKKSRGFGRVKFVSNSVAREAIARLNGSLFLDRYKLYIGFEREPETKEEPFECSTEQMLYLTYCFFDSPVSQTLSLKQALPAKVISKNSMVYLVGRPQEIQSSCEILNRFLSGLSYKMVLYRYDHWFKRILEESFIPSISQNKITLILKTERLHRICVHIFSHDSELLLSTYQNFQGIQPHSVRHSLTHASLVSESDIDRYICCGDVSKQYNTIAVQSAHMHGKSLVIHGLNRKDIEQSWKSICKKIESTTVSKSISIKLFQLKHIQSMNKEAFQADCKIDIPSISETNNSLEMIYKVIISGEVSKVSSVVTKVETLICNCVLESCVVRCQKQFLTILKNRWENFSKLQEQECNVLVEYETVVEHTNNLTEQLIKFNIYGASLEVQSVKQKVLEKECKLSIYHVTLSHSEFSRFLTNKVMVCKQLEDSFSVHLSVTAGVRYVTIHYPINADINTARVESKLKALIAAIPSPLLVKSITVSDKQLADLLVEHKWSTLVKSVPQGVNLSKQKNAIEIKGTPEDINKGFHFVERYKDILKTQLKTTHLSLPMKYASVISSAQFTSSLADIESTAGVGCYIPVPQTDESILEQTTLKFEDNSCTVQVCKGRILSEKVDAVIIPIETQLGISRSTTITTKNIMEISGSAFKKAYYNYLEHQKLTPGDAVKFPCENLPFHTVIFIVVKPSNRIALSQAIQKAFNFIYENRLGSASISVDTELATDDVHVCEVVLNEVNKAVKISSPHTIRIVVPDSQTTLEHTLISKVFQKYNQEKEECVSLRVSVSSPQSPYLHYHSSSISQSPTSSMKHRWYWEDDSGVFIEYSQAIADLLTTKWQINPNTLIRVPINGQIYDIDLQKMVQINCISKTKRIMRHTSHSDSDENIHWCYQDDTGSFTPYETEQSEAMEIMYQNQSYQQLKIGKWTYEFNFATMHQINTKTKRQRPIKRVVAKDPVQSNTTAENVYIGIRGIQNNIESASKLILSKLESLLMTKTVNLPSEKSISENQISDISCKHKQVEILQSQKSICISGDEASVNGALIDIQAEIIKITSQTHMHNTSEPTEWSPQARTCELFEVAKNSSEWIKISSLFESTMSGYKIKSIQRVQNQLLWERYRIEKETIEKKNGGQANEKFLFHGSRKVRAEDIVDSDSGLDMRLSSEGMWGRANYFAEKASYSDTYAYQCFASIKELILCKVITGDSIKLSPDSSLRMPPEKQVSETDVTLKKVRYDSVNGVTHGSQVYMTYDNYKSYPAYVITYFKQFQLPESHQPQSLSVFQSGFYGI